MRLVVSPPLFPLLSASSPTLTPPSVSNFFSSPPSPTTNLLIYFSSRSLFIPLTSFHFFSLFTFSPCLSVAVFFLSVFIFPPICLLISHFLFFLSSSSFFLFLSQSPPPFHPIITSFWLQTSRLLPSLLSFFHRLTLFLLLFFFSVSF